MALTPWGLPSFLTYLKSYCTTPVKLQLSLANASQDGKYAKRRISLLVFQHVEGLHAVFRAYGGPGHPRVLHPLPGSRPCGGSTQRVRLPTLRRILSAGREWSRLRVGIPDEPVKSKLDSWFLYSGRRAAAPRKRAPFLPDLHDEVAKAWAVPQSARAHAGGSKIFTKVDGAEARGYTRIPPVEESIAAHLCPSSASLKTGATLPSRPFRLTTHVADKAYSASGEAISALHTMAVLQVFQAQLLKSLDEGRADPEAFKDLHAATDFALKATKKTAQAIGRSMGYMVVLHRHLRLTLTELKDADRRALLNAPVSPSGLFGDAVKAIAERFSEAQKYNLDVQSLASQVLSVSTTCGSSCNH
ncbi:uncharacterized protein LOC132105393 [Carassius carassius]|uniref:uncharacterized protein LOC132105393 n=1 Tax=Carassius carassius TaxID=217509 RepID=UPI002868C7DC|nr:uncharacterized protein LOC132105393 [Carassius carassius]